MAAKPPYTPNIITAAASELLSDGIACFQSDDALTPRYLNPSLMDFLGVSAPPGSLASYT